MTADASTLVTPSDYLRITQDAVGGDTCAAALNEALDTIQDIIGRVLVAGDYVETLYVYRNDTVYPSATPISAVITPNSSISIQGAGIVIGSFDPFPTLTGWPSSGIPAQITITYSGGYTAATLPAKLRRAICRAAFNILHPSQLMGLPAGVNRVQVGDVGYSAAGNGSLRTFDPIDDGVMRDIKGYRNPNFRGWQIEPVPAP